MLLHKSLLLLLLMTLPHECAAQKIKRTACPGLMPSGGQAYALVIGVSEYNTAKLDNLPKPKEEAKDLAKILAAQGYKVTVLCDAEATRANVQRELSQKRNAVDRVLVYFSGHGMDFTTLQAYMPEEYLRKYYAAERAAFQKVANPDSLNYLMLALHQQREEFGDVIGAHEIVEELNHSLAHQKIIIIDACYSGIARPLPPPIPIYSPRVIEDGLAVITGAKEKIEDGQHSPFLFAGLRGAADTTWAGNRDGCVSAYELAVFMDGVLRFKVGEMRAMVYKIRYALIGSGEMQLVRY